MAERESPIIDRAVGRRPIPAPVDLYTAIASSLGIRPHETREPKIRSRLELLLKVLRQDAKLEPAIDAARRFYEGRPDTGIKFRTAEAAHSPAEREREIREKLDAALSGLRSHTSEIMAKLDALDTAIATVTESTVRSELSRLADNAAANGSSALASRIKSENVANLAQRSAVESRSAVNSEQMNLIFEYLSRRGQADPVVSTSLASALQKAAKATVESVAKDRATETAIETVRQWERGAAGELMVGVASDPGIAREELDKIAGQLVGGSEIEDISRSSIRKLAAMVQNQNQGTNLLATVQKQFQVDFGAASRRNLSAFLEERAATRAVAAWKKASEETILKETRGALIESGVPPHILAMVVSANDPLSALADRARTFGRDVGAGIARVLEDPEVRGTVERLGRDIREAPKGSPGAVAGLIEKASAELATKLRPLLADVKTDQLAKNTLRWKPSRLGEVYRAELASAQEGLAAAQSARNVALEQARKDIASACETVEASRTYATYYQSEVDKYDAELRRIRDRLAEKNETVRQYDNYWYVDPRRLTEKDAYDKAKQQIDGLKFDVKWTEYRLAGAKAGLEGAVAPRWAIDRSSKTPEELLDASVNLRVREAQAAVDVTRARVERGDSAIQNSPGIGRLADETTLKEVLKAGQVGLTGPMQTIVEQLTDLDVRRPEMDSRAQTMAAAKIVVAAGDLIAHDGLRQVPDATRQRIVSKVVGMLSTLNLDSINILEKGDSILTVLSQAQDKKLFSAFLQSVASLEAAAASYQYHDFARHLGDMMSRAERVASERGINLDTVGFYRKAGEIIVDFLPALRQKRGQEFVPEGEKDGEPWLITAEQLRPLLAKSDKRQEIIDHLATIQQQIHDARWGEIPGTLGTFVAVVRRSGADARLVQAVVDAASTKLGSILPGFAGSVPLFQELLQRTEPLTDLLSPLGRVFQSAKTGATSEAIAGLSDLVKAGAHRGVSTDKLDKLLGSALTFLRNQPGLTAAESLLKLEYLRPAGPLNASVIKGLFDSLTELQEGLGKRPPDLPKSFAALSRMIPADSREKAFESFKSFALSQLGGLSSVVGTPDLNQTLKTLLANGERAGAFVTKAQDLGDDIQAGRYPKASRDLSDMYVALRQEPAFETLKEKFKQDAVAWIRKVPGTSSVINLDRVDQVISDPATVETVVQSLLDIGSAVKRGDPGGGLEAVGHLAGALPQERDALVGWMRSNLKGLGWLDDAHLSGILSAANRGAQALVALRDLHNAASKADLPAELKAIGDLVNAATDPETQKRLADDAAATVVKLLPPLKDVLGKDTISSLLRSNWGSIAQTVARLSDAMQKEKVVDVAGEARALVDALPDDLKSVVAVKLCAEISKAIPPLRDFGKEAERLERSGALLHFLHLLDHMTHNRPGDVAKDLGEIMKSLTTTAEGMLLLGDTLMALVKLLPPEVGTKLLAAVGGKAIAGAIPIVNILVAAVGVGVALPDALAVLNRPGATPMEKAIALAKLASAAAVAIPAVGPVASTVGDVIITLLQFSQAFDFNSIMGGAP